MDPHVRVGIDVGCKAHRVGIGGRIRGTHTITPAQPLLLLLTTWDRCAKSTIGRPSCLSDPIESTRLGRTLKRAAHSAGNPSSVGSKL